MKNNVILKQNKIHLGRVWFQLPEVSGSRKLFSNLMLLQQVIPTN